MRLDGQRTGPNGALLVSASSVKTYARCPRRWAFKAVEGLREVATEPQKRGTLVHAELEAWGRHGTPPKHPMAVALRPLAPPPGVAELEVPIRFETPRSSWIGYVDAACDLDARGRYVPLGTTGITCIVDYKTTSDLKYVPEIDTLLDDEAVSIYGWEAFLGGARRVIGRWLYVSSAGRTRTVQLDLDLRHTLKHIIELDGIGAEMQLCYQRAARALDVECDIDACYDFHARCPFMDRCRPNATFF